MGEVTPDGVPCRHCGKPIFWDEICWVHDNGFADCGLSIEGGTRIDRIIMDPDIYVDPTHKAAGNKAEPEGEWS
jgi:hypothetical protein